MPISSKTTIRQIIADIDRRYPNTYSNEDKIYWMNDAMKQIFTDIAIPEFYSFSTIRGQNLYVLPEDCTMEHIKNVEMSEKAKSVTNSDYGTFYSLQNSLRDRNMHKKSYYDATNGMIGLYPIPDKSGYKINVYYNKRPKMITSLDDYIELDDRYSSLVTFLVIRTIAMSGHNPDVEIANQYTLEYNTLLQDARESKYEDHQKYPRTRDEKLPQLKYRRRRIW